MHTPRTGGDVPAPDTERVSWARQTCAAIHSLTPSQREFVELAFFDQLSQADIAERLDVSVLMVKATLASALQRVAAAVEGASTV